jgi:hypothetical protein
MSYPCEACLPDDSDVDEDELFIHSMPAGNEDDDDDGDYSDVEVVERADAAIAFPDESSDEVEVVDRPEVEEALPYQFSGEDSELAVVGVANVQILAHPHSACPIHPFGDTHPMVHCKKCYCIPCHNSIQICGPRVHCHVRA